MGQTSLPCLNRAGTSAFWNSLWDSKLVYPLYLTKFTYINMFFNSILKNKLFFSKFINLKKGFKTPVYFFKNFKALTHSTTYYKAINRYYFCTSKLWVLKYGSWIILSIYIFDLGNKFSKKKKRIKKNIKLLNKKTKTLYNTLAFKDLFKRSRKNKKLLVKKILKRLKKFFKFKGLHSKIDSIFSIKKIKLFKTLNKRRLKKRMLRRKFFRKTFINIKTIKYLKKKESTLAKINTLNNHIEKEKYDFF